MSNLVPINNIERLIYFIRGHRVMLDADLADLYQVETGALNQAVKRNIKRFPEDFMFELTSGEWENLKSQNVISSSWGGRRKLPRVFTQEGVAMLSGILHSEKAIEANIEIMRTFVRFRNIIAQHQELMMRIDALEERHDQQFSTVFDAIRQLMNPPDTLPKAVGFQLPERKKKP